MHIPYDWILSGNGIAHMASQELRIIYLKSNNFVIESQVQSTIIIGNDVLILNVFAIWFQIYFWNKL